LPTEFLCRYTVINRLMTHLKLCCPEHDYNLIFNKIYNNYNVPIEHVYINKENLRQNEGEMRKLARYYDGGGKMTKYR
jgi:hypothetical protein